MQPCSHTGRVRKFVFDLPAINSRELFAFIVAQIAKVVKKNTPEPAIFL